MKSILTYLFFISVFSIKTNVIIAQATDVQDSLALIELYDSTNGDNWVNNTGWLNGPVYTWNGIVVDTTIGKVISVTLHQNNLSGTIPSTIKNLSNLKYLDLSYNFQLKGFIPNSLGELINLETLWLTGNKFSGNIPNELGNLINIKTLWLSGNQLTGSIPRELGNLINLMNLSLDGNQLSNEIPPELGNLQNLQNLILYNNKLSGKIPLELGNLQNLRTLWLNNNHLIDGIPLKLSNDINLQKFSLQHNNFTFDGTEKLVESFNFAEYAPQDSILHIHRANSIFSVSAGGTLSNNTYKWFRDGVLDATIRGDSTYKPTKAGKYHVEITNSIATQLTLYSNTISPISIVNPNPSLITSDGSIKQDISQLDYSKIVSAAATDGVTKLLLVTYSEDPIIFSMEGNKNGTLSSLNDQKTHAISISIEPDVNGKVVAVYTVPDGYGRNYDVKDGRYITIKTANQNNEDDTSSLKIKLVTPPLVLVHGMWSDPTVWINGGFTTALNNGGFPKPSLADYKPFNSWTFNPSNPASYPGRSSVALAVYNALSSYQNQKIAVTQVDIVGHSLGGLLARSWSQQPEFKDVINFQKGYIHKLITLATPHRGSPLGPELWNSQNNIIYVPTKTYPFILKTTVGAYLKLQGMPIGSCHQDFAIESEGVKALKQTLPFHSYAITADYKGLGAASEQTAGYIGLYELCKIALNKSFDQIMASRCAGLYLPNDLIVPFNSQQGYINKDTLFWGTGHSIPASNTETNNSLIQEKVIRLLLSNDTTEFNPGFPAPSNFALDCNTSNRLSANTNTSNLSSDNLKETNLSTESDSQYVQIVSPVKGTSYNQSSGKTITLQFRPVNGALPTHCLFMVEDIGWFTANVTSNYTVSFTLPAKAAVGNKSIVLMVKDTTGLILGDTSHIVITSNGTLDNLSVEPGIIYLDSSSREQSVYVHGYFKSANATVDNNLTDESTGTVYSTKNGGVFSIEKNGLIVAKKAGIDTLLVTNNSITIKVPVIVDSNFTAAKLYVNIIDFPAIADKIIDDSPFGLTAFSSSGDPVSFSLISGNATLENGLLVVNAPGKITVKASQPGNVYFAPAVDVYQTFCIDPLVPSLIKGDTITCTGTQTYSINKVQDIKNEWKISEGGIVTSSDTTATITWNTTGKHTIMVTPYTTDSCYGSSQQLIVNGTTPPIPTISSVGDTILISSTANYYQWYFNNNTLSGETSKSLHIDKVGFYKVETSFDTTCWASSLDYPVIVTQSPLPDTLKMAIYPNPTSTGKFNVDVKLPQTTGVTTYVTVYDINGVQVLQTNKLIFFADEIRIPITLTTKGTFIVKVYINGDSRQQTVIIM